MAAPKPNQLTTCPYDLSHQLEHYRVHTHIHKCKKQYKTGDKVACPFDASHIVNEVELDHHVSTCPKRIMFDSQVYITDDEYRPVVEVSTTTPVIQSEENWDDDATSSYVPDPAKKGPHIIKKVKGATRSERRKARMEGIKNYKPPEDQV